MIIHTIRSTFQFSNHLFSIIVIHIAEEKDYGVWRQIDALIKNNSVRKKGLSKSIQYYFSVIPVFPNSDSKQHENGNPMYTYSVSSAPMQVADLTLSKQLASFFPENLLQKSGAQDIVTVKTNAALKDMDLVAIYFSAHWW
jgi:hypothetical protein